MSFVVKLMASLVAVGGITSFSIFPPFGGGGQGKEKVDYGKARLCVTEYSSGDKSYLWVNDATLSPAPMIGIGSDVLSMNCHRLPKDQLLENKIMKK